MKKILSIGLLFVLCISAPFQGFAESQDLTEEEEKLIQEIKPELDILFGLIDAEQARKNLITNVPRGIKYANAIDKIIDEKKYDKVYLQKLVRKLNEKRRELTQQRDNTKARQIVYIIDYINKKAEDELLKIEFEEEVSKKEELSKILSGEVSKISETDASEAKKRILSLQSNILESSEDAFTLLKKYTSYKQSGFAEMRLNIDEESFGTLMSELKITDYVSKNNLFDSQFTGDVEGRLEYSVASKDLKVEFSSFVDAIMKDGQFYVMLDKVKSIIESEDPEVSALADIFKKISTQGKYVRFSDENLGDIKLSKEMVENFMNINKYRSLFAKPALKAYKKEGEKYYLMPTKSFCNEAKKLFGGVLGNIGDGNCNEGQYNDMVEEFIEQTNAYMTMDGNISTLYMEEASGVSKMNISFDENTILSANMEIIEEGRWNTRKALIGYNRGKEMNISIQSRDLNGSFYAILKSDNTLESFEMQFKSEEDFHMSMNLKNENLEGFIKGSLFGEDSFTMDISGTLKKDYLDAKVMFEFMDFIKRSEDTYKGTLEIGTDTRNNKNNFDMSLLINQSEKNIVELDVVSESTIEYGEVEIQIPTDFVEVEDVWSEDNFSEMN